MSNPAEILRNPLTNKDLGFSIEERKALKIDGFLPPAVETIEQQVERAYKQMSTLCNTQLEKFIFLRHLHDSNERLFFALVLAHTIECLPLVYTPTVGEACLKWSQIWPSKTRGLYLTKEHRGRIAEVLDIYAIDRPDIKIIVLTDGSRILGLGDIGCNGMGIPIGKLSLYTAGAGFDPAVCLPVMIDTGCTKEDVINDPHYIGQRIPKQQGDDFYGLVDEFLNAADKKWPGVVQQFEDFSNNTAFPLLNKYREQICCFNDDIQGTGVVIAAGVINALKAAGRALPDERIVFFGAGSAGVGVADVIVDVMVKEHSISYEEARRKFYLIDSEGLVTKSRQGRPLAVHKVPYAHESVPQECKSLMETVKMVKPTMLVGLGAQPRVFTQEVVEEVMKHCDRPIIMALSNPTTKMEITAADAYTWTKGKCIYFSGSPQPKFEYEGKTFVPGQGNNMYVFPALGMGLSLVKATKCTDTTLYVVARALADVTPQENIDQGNMYPCLSKIREISRHLAARVMKNVFEEGNSLLDKLPEDLEAFVEANQWIPTY
ncbi:hypothetical protein P9112_006933 [Eukaryota sp. TZLM1-RC]